MKRKNKISAVIAVGFLALGVAISTSNIAVNSTILSGTFAVGLSLLFTTLYKHFRYGDGVEQDERIKKILYRALEGSWFATFILMATIMLAEDFGALKLNVRGALSIVFFFMVFSFSALNWYFDQKGDAV